MQGPVEGWPQVLLLVTLWLHSIPGQPPHAKCSTRVIKANGLAATVAIGPRRHKCRREADPSMADPPWHQAQEPACSPSCHHCLVTQNSPRHCLASLSTAADQHH